MTYTDQSLTCRDCSRPFAFTAGEQEFYASRGLLNTPGRCPDCRAARKAGGSYTASPAGERGGYAERAPARCTKPAATPVAAWPACPLCRAATSRSTAALASSRTATATATSLISPR